MSVFGVKCQMNLEKSKFYGEKKNIEKAAETLPMSTDQFRSMIQLKSHGIEVEIKFIELLHYSNIWQTLPITWQSCSDFLNFGSRVDQIIITNDIFATNVGAMCVCVCAGANNRLESY